MFQIKKKASSGALFATLRAAVQKTINALCAKKMIVNAMIRRIDVYNGYKLNIEFNVNIRQFFEGIAEEAKALAETA